MTEEERLDLLCLTMVPGVGPLTARALLDEFGSAGAVLSARESGLRNVPGVGPKLSAKLVRAREDHDPREELARCERAGVRPIAPGDAEYPASLRRLDPSSAAPQIVFTSYTRGAHCCTVTKIATQMAGAWRIVDGKMLDGGGYAFEDIDQDGVYELVNADNRFYYAFAPYASSRTPIEISSLVGGRLVDVSGAGRFRSYQRQQVFALEHEASLDGSLWSSNGFLAAWVANKALVGEMADAWPRMLASYDRSSDWQMTECTVATKGACPAGLERRLDFPEALRRHLEKTGYIAPSTPSAVVAPKPPAQTAVTAPPVAPPPSSKPAAKGASTGTGFFVTRDGHAVTNAHVVDGCSAIEVKTRDGVLPARLVSSDKTNDLALLKIDTEAKAIATLKPGVRLGEPVAAFGFPLNTVLASAGNFTLGNVTALAGLGDDSRFVQISTPVQPGNSGGPLLDENGNVVGVVTAKLNALVTAVATGDVPQNVNFAIKASTLSIFLESSRVPLQAEIRETRLSAPDLADAANAMSLFVRCR